MVFGKLFFKNRAKFNEYLLSLHDGEYETIVRKPKKTVSDPQRKYYRGVVCKMIADETGHTAQEIHEHLAWTFLIIPDPVLKLRRSTERGDLSTSEMEDYLLQCRTWAVQTFGITIPLPNEVDMDSIK